MDKLKQNKKLCFLIGLSFIAFVFGVFFITIITKNDVLTVKEHISSFINNIHNNNIDFIMSLKENIIYNLSLIIIIWLLGISIIGIPIIVFIYFFQIFSIGFTISSFITTYKIKGCLFSILYLFPNETLKYFIYILLLFNSLKISKNIIDILFKKKEINFDSKFKKYIKILIISLLLSLIYSLYNTFIIPFIFNKLYFLIK